MNTSIRVWLAAGMALALSACTPTQTGDALSRDEAAALSVLADRMIAMELRASPLLGYFADVGVADHRRWGDVSPAALRAYEADSDGLLAALGELNVERLTPSDRAIVAGMREDLESGQQMRICRRELWAVSHMGGWHLSLSTAAREQPVETAEERAWAMERWSALPGYIDQQIANARAGLNEGYSAPKSVVRRVMQQFDGIVGDTSENNPLYGPAARSLDLNFAVEFRALIDGPVRDSLRTYRTFLEQEYLPRARSSLPVTAHPNGAACYQAFLRSYTTLQRTPQEVYELGRATVAANAERVRELGSTAFGTGDLAQIAERIPNASDNRFGSEEELITFSRQIVERARGASATLFNTMPSQPVVVEPFEAFRRNAGGSSYYQSQPDRTQPATYRIQSVYWQDETRGGAEITAVHEAFPGHHMQIALAAAQTERPISRILGNSAYVEGWARYAEALAEEAGIYATPYAPMTRRLWPARGMVVDPGLHVMGWTPEQVIEFIRESGRFRGEDAAGLVDRIAIMPGQLTAYDSGGLEILALRREAEQALGDRFDVRDFHERVLEHGSVPLTALRGNVTAWIARESAAAP
jgi:uncharacterized protein (DUF885 family)